MQKEFDRGSPSLMERCDKLDEQCTQTCRILRVWSTDRVLSSLNGFMAWRRIFWHHGLDEGTPSHPERTLASMEQQYFGRDRGRTGKVEGRRDERNDRGHREAPLSIHGLEKVES